MFDTEQYLSKSEILQVETGLHPVVMNRQLGTALMVLGAAALSFVGAIKLGPSAVLFYAMGTVLAVGGIGIAVRAALRRAAVTVLVTDRRILEIRGMVAHTVSELRLDAIQGVTVDQSIFGRIFNFGTVTLLAGNDRPMVLRDIRFPLELQQALQDHRTRREEKDEKLVRA